MSSSFDRRRNGRSLLAHEEQYWDAVREWAALERLCMLAGLLVTADLHRTRTNGAEVKEEVEAAEGEDKWRWHERVCRSGWAITSMRPRTSWTTVSGDGERNGLGDG